LHVIIQNLIVCYASKASMKHTLFIYYIIL
jgi:hypothetical protein